MLWLARPASNALGVEHVVAIASSGEKCRFLLGVLTALHYRSSTFKDEFIAATTNNIDIYAVCPFFLLLFSPHDHLLDSGTDANNAKNSNNIYIASGTLWQVISWHLDRMSSPVAPSLPIRKATIQWRYPLRPTWPSFFSKSIMGFITKDPRD